MQIYLSGQNLFESKEGRRQVIQAVLGARELRHELTYGCLCSNSLLRTEIIHVSGIAYKCFFLHEVFPCIIRKKQSLFAFWSYDIVYTLSILVYFFFFCSEMLSIIICSIIPYAMKKKHSQPKYGTPSWFQLVRMQRKCVLQNEWI